MNYPGIIWECNFLLRSMTFINLTLNVNMLKEEKIKLDQCFLPGK